MDPFDPSQSSLSETVRDWGNISTYLNSSQHNKFTIVWKIKIQDNFYIHEIWPHFTNKVVISLNDEKKPTIDHNIIQLQKPCSHINTNTGHDHHLKSP